MSIRSSTTHFKLYTSDTSLFSGLMVLDEPMLYHPVTEDITTYKSTSNFMTEHPKKTSILNNSFYSKPDDPDDISLVKKSLLINPANEDDIERIVKVPVRFVDGPVDEFFLLQIPENKLNISGMNSILKIEVLKNDEFNVKDVNVSKSFDSVNSLKNESLILEESKLFNKIEHVKEVLDKKPNFDVYNDTLKVSERIGESNEKVVSINNETIDSKSERIVKNVSSVDVNNATQSPNLIRNLTKNESTRNVKHLDVKGNEGAIYNLQNLLINDEQPSDNATSTTEALRLFEIPQNSTERRKVHRQRVLIYRGSAKYQPTNSSSQRKWIMKKVVRKRVRPAKAKSADDLDSSATAPVADVINNDTEVSFDVQKGRAKKASHKK